MTKTKPKWYRCGLCDRRYSCWKCHTVLYHQPYSARPDVFKARQRVGVPPEGSSYAPVMIEVAVA